MYYLGPLHDYRHLLTDVMTALVMHLVDGCAMRS